MVGTASPKDRRRHLLETDDFEQALISAAWFSKQIPKKRNFNYASGYVGRGRGRIQQRPDDASATNEAKGISLQEI